MKKAVLYCTCCGALEAALPPQALQEALARRTPCVLPAAVAPGDQGRKNRDARTVGPENAGIEFIACTRLCRKTEAEAALQTAVDAGAQAVVAAACSLSARGREGRAHLAGAVPVEWVDVREGCVWIHAASATETLDKALDVICMGLAALEQRGSLAAGTPPVERPEAVVLVAGGGPAGMACAAALGGMGVAAILAERQAEPGGMLPRLGKLFPHLTSGDDLLRALTRDMREAGVQLETKTTVVSAHPSGRGYTVSLRGPDGERDVDVNALVLATGAIPVLPKGYFRHGELRGVSSQMELELLLAKVERGEESCDALPRRAVFLQCVAARDDKYPYCSAVCCPTALKNALRLKALVPDGMVTVVHRNIVTPGIHLEELYRTATAVGVALRSFDPLVTPEALGADTLEGLRFRDALDGGESVLPADCLVCSTPLRPMPGTAGLAQSLGLRLDDMGFACGREPILPLAPHRAGVYLCGSVRWPATVEQSLEQGRAAAAKAAAFVRGRSAPEWREDLPWTLRELLGLSADSSLAAHVREEGCSRCGRCASACPYGALELPEHGAMRVIPSRCGQCGSCAAVCPTGAAALPGETLGATRVRIREALGGGAI